MSKYTVINLKTEPELKKRAAEVADRLGVSISAVLNNELKRFATEQCVTFEIPEVPNYKIARKLERSRKSIESGDYHHFDNSDEALEFLAKELK